MRFRDFVNEAMKTESDLPPGVFVLGYVGKSSISFSYCDESGNESSSIFGKINAYLVPQCNAWEVTTVDSTKGF